MSHQSPDKKKDILMLMKRVADWQLVFVPLKHPHPSVNPSPSKHRYTEDAWTWASCYIGMMALSDISDVPKYDLAMQKIGQKFKWKPAKRVYHADDHAITQTYLELYLRHRDQEMIQPTQKCFDYILAHRSTNELLYEKREGPIKRSSNDKDKVPYRYYWCDSLFMGPPAWALLYAATGDRSYLKFLDEEWWFTSNYLYDKEEHLYWRDSRYFNQEETNGKKVFWSRGNGWVIAGLARVLRYLPKDYPTYPRYEQQFKEMATKIAALQQSDGLWRASLLDPGSFPLKETSGSGFNIFALAWGLNNGLLNRTVFEPVVKKGWQALVECVTPAGKLEHVQPVGSDPKNFSASDTEVYGVGAFLMAGKEMYIFYSEKPVFSY